MNLHFITDLKSLEETVKLRETTESGHLEFKERVEIGSRLPEHVKIENRLELCRDVSQFANTDGGCLLIGVSESTSPAGVALASDFVGVQDIESLKQQIEETLNIFVVPSTFRRTTVVIELPTGKSVLAVNVPASDQPVFVWNRSKGWIQCYRRSSHGKVAQNPHEIEALLMDKARAMRLRLNTLIHDRTQQVFIHSGVWMEEPPSWTAKPSEQISATLLSDYRACVSQIGESEFSLLLTYKTKSLTINIPYGFVEEIWRDATGVVTLSLARKIGVVRDETRLYLERRPAGT